MTKYFDKFKHKTRRQLELAVAEVAASGAFGISGSHKLKTESLAMLSLQAGSIPRRSLIAAIGDAVVKIGRARTLSLGLVEAHPATHKLVLDTTSLVTHKKMAGILSELGLQTPQVATATTTHGTKFYVANSSNIEYLPSATSLSFTYEDADNGGGNEPVAFSQSPSAPGTPGATTPRNSRFGNFSSPNYLTTNLDSETPIPHTFAVIVEVQSLLRDVSTLQIDFALEVGTVWPVSSDGLTTTERFLIGNLQWLCLFLDPDFFIPAENSKHSVRKPLSPQELSERTRNYRLANVNQLAMGVDAPVDVVGAGGSLAVVEAGLYVYVLPILLPSHLPALILLVNGSLAHNLRARFYCGSKAESMLYQLPAVRTPPLIANSVVDKPIFVNRVWNDSIHYVITFPKKYVAIGTEHMINVKLIPLVKDVIIKRIRFNVLERITYISRDLSKEYSYDTLDPTGALTMFPRLRPPKSRERVVSLCELKTKAKRGQLGQVPFKEDIIKCPENNLLYLCYEPELKRQGGCCEEGGLIASPIDITVALPFLTTKFDMLGDNTTSIGVRDTRLSTMPSSGPRRSSVPNALNYSPDVIPGRTLGTTSVSKAVYPDLNFRHIQINHRLQVCFRISKPESNDSGKMHHYEVVVDTPLILLLAKCPEDSMQLPLYAELEVRSLGVSVAPITNLDNFGFDDQLPSFDEAIRTERSNSLVDEDSGYTRGITPDVLPDLVEQPTPLELPDMECGGLYFGDISRSSFDLSRSPLSRLPPPPLTAPRFGGTLHPPSYSLVDEIIAPDQSSGVATNISDGSTATTTLALDAPLDPLETLDAPLEPSTTNNTLVGDGVNDDETKSIDTGFFEQRLPLLQHYLLETISRSRGPATTA